MYQINDYVMCGENGVCKVVEIGKPPIGGLDKQRNYYFLEPIKGKTNIIYSPVDLEKKSLRYVIEKKDAKQLLDEIDGLDIYWEERDSLRKEQYKNVINQYNCYDWLRMIKSVYHKKKELMDMGKKLHSVDMIYLTKLEALLYDELSFAMGVPKEDVVKFISDKLEE